MMQDQRSASVELTILVTPTMIEWLSRYAVLKDGVPLAPEQAALSILENEFEVWASNPTDGEPSPYARDDNLPV